MRSEIEFTIIMLHYYGMLQLQFVNITIDLMPNITKKTITYDLHYYGLITNITLFPIFNVQHQT